MSAKHMSSFERTAQIASAAAFVAGGLVWAVAPLVTDAKEAWDSPYYYVVAAAAPFAISAATLRWKEVIGAWYFGQVLYLATFRNSLAGEPNLLVVGMALLMTLPFPLVGSLAGWGVRWLFSRFVSKSGD